jgi:hypothetical protein
MRPPEKGLPKKKAIMRGNMGEHTSLLLSQSPDLD